MRIALTASALFWALVYCTAASAQTPVEITEEIIRETKKNKSIDAALDHIDWEGALHSLEPAERKQMKFSTAEKYREYQLDVYRGNSAKVAEGLDRALSTAADPKQRAILEATKEQLDNELSQQRTHAEQAFSKTTYTIGSSTTGTDTAEVELIKHYNGRQTRETLRFKRVEGAWKLQSAAAFNPRAGDSTASTELLGPPASSPDSTIVRPF